MVYIIFCTIYPTHMYCCRGVSVSSHCARHDRRRPPPPSSSFCRFELEQCAGPYGWSRITGRVLRRSRIIKIPATDRGCPTKAIPVLPARETAHRPAIFFIFLLSPTTTLLGIAYALLPRSRHRLLKHIQNTNIEYTFKLPSLFLKHV